ncbi:Protein YceI [uncultured bacterium]|nr:Protein YceI [uncultured bacterium]
MKLFFVFMAALLFAAAADAAPVIKEQSRITFVSRQMGVPVEGSFKRFDAEVEFDPKETKKSRASITIYLDSIDAGSEEASIEIKRKPWFDVKNHPKAEFKSASLSFFGPGRYRVSGNMTIKGRTRPAFSDFTVKERGGYRVFEGKFTLKRLEFAIGEGAWSDIGTVADEVDVSYVFSVPVQSANK